MNGELYYLNHKSRMRVLWIIAYVIIFAALVFGIYQATTRIKTHTIPSGKVVLKIPYSKYLVGETISYTLTNNFNSSIRVLNGCPNEPLEVFRQDNGKWVRQHEQIAKNDCKDEEKDVSVPANGVISGTFGPWQKLFSTPGKYRVVASVEFYNALAFQDFEIIPQPIAVPAGNNSVTSPAATTPVNSQTAPTQTAPVAAVNPVAVTPFTPKKTQTIRVPNAGTIIVQYDSTNIYVTSIAPTAGCRYQGGNSGTQVQVTYICGQAETQVSLSIVNGQLVSKISNAAPRDD